MDRESEEERIGFMQEKRKYVRANGLLNVKYKIPTLQVEGKSLAVNISGGGIRIHVKTKLESTALPESKTIIELEVTLPNDTLPIFAKGEIVWSSITNTGRKEGFFDTGIKFIEIKDYDRDRIIKYVYSQLHREK